MRYPDCQRSDGDCSICSLSSYGRDCRNAPVNTIAYLRIQRGMTQQQLADAAGISIGQVSKFEYGERDIGGASLRIAIKIADAMEIKDLRELL